MEEITGFCLHGTEWAKPCMACHREAMLRPVVESYREAYPAVAELWQPTDTDAQGYEKFAVALETQADEMSAAMETFEGHADVVAGFMCTASWLRRTAKAIRELGK